MQETIVPRTALIPFMALLVMSAATAGSSTLTIEPQMVESKYCLEPEGVVSFRVTLRLKYYNTGETPILLPRITRLSAQMFFRDQHELDTKRAVTREVFKKVQMYDTAKLDPSVPDPKLFDIVHPGETFDQREHQVIIVVRPDFPFGVRLLGTDLHLRVEIDHWPDARAPGERLRRSWRPYGLLWIDKIVSSPVQIHIEKEPAAKPCREPPIVTIRRKRPVR